MSREDWRYMASRIPHAVLTLLVVLAGIVVFLGATAAPV